MASNVSNDSTLLLGLAVVVLTTTVLWMKSKKDQMTKKVATSPFPGIPVAPGAHWLLGHLLALHSPDEFAGNQHCLQDYADPATGLCSIWGVTGKRVLSVLSGKDAKAVLMASKTKPSHAYVSHHLRKLVGAKAMILLQGKEWKLYRTAVHKSMTPMLLQQSQQAINKVGKTLVQSLLACLEQQQSSSNTCKSIQRNIFPLMKMATADVFGATMLGVDFQSCQRFTLPPMAESFEYLANEFERRVKAPFDVTAMVYGIPTRANRQHAHHQHLIRSYILQQMAIIQQQENSDNNNLLSHIWNAAVTEAETIGERMDMEAVCDVALTLFFAGYDTTSITLSYALYELAQHPDIYQHCVEEIDAILGGDKGGQDNTIVAPDKQLPFTHAVIQETLRLYSPVMMVGRVLEKKLRLGSHTFEAGTSVYLPLWLIQRHSLNFPRPLEFRPDRWVRRRHCTNTASDSDTTKSQWEERPSNDTASSDIPPGDRDAFLAFSTGARNCVGRNLALREAVTLLAQLLHKLKFEFIDPSYQVKSMVRLLNQPADGLPMIIKPREEQQ